MMIFSLTNTKNLLAACLEFHDFYSADVKRFQIERDLGKHEALFTP